MAKCIVNKDTDLMFSFNHKGLGVCSVELYIVIYHVGINNDILLLTFLCLSFLKCTIGIIQRVTAGD